MIVKIDDDTRMLDANFGCNKDGSVDEFKFIMKLEPIRVEMAAWQFGCLVLMQVVIIITTIKGGLV